MYIDTKRNLDPLQQKIDTNLDPECNLDNLKYESNVYHVGQY